MAHAAWKWMAVAAAVGAAVLACGGDDDEGGTNNPPTGIDAGVNEVRPGLGDDPGEPLGTQFNLPTGVTVSGTVYGADDLTSDCGNGAPGNGSGVYVQVCVPLRNSTGGPVEVVFPPGLVIVSTSEGFQNGLLVERVVITVPPTPPGPGGPPDGGTDPDATVVPLFTYCLNESQNPNEKGTPYKLGPVTSDSALKELLQLLSGKRIDSPEDVDVVQEALYSITESKGLTAEDRAAINKL
ncbi:hypothetical protein JY651_08995 [Pyxidicoccus parkwayensis]|uniref:Lipoprotein n=1 Tax=Pyxidicoccus parkwayensis TaxID=2813578 RepID=A0ABX7P3J9_9BACT|nr:hypothetical protein [Pyxidicoccus parkwaysis]QSQ25049.1 hypothetical protein JY651_08995 [Pyxidicoccus parkwaysis]